MFDASALSVAENKRQTTEVVAEAHRYGAGVEGEIEGIQGVEDGYGSDEISTQQSLDTALDFGLPAGQRQYLRVDWRLVGLFVRL